MDRSCFCRGTPSIGTLCVCVPAVCVRLLYVPAVYAHLEIFAKPPLRPGLNWGAMSNPGLSLKRKSDTQPRSSEQAMHNSAESHGTVGRSRMHMCKMRRALDACPCRLQARYFILHHPAGAPLHPPSFSAFAPGSHTIRSHGRKSDPSKRHPSRRSHVRPNSRTHAPLL